MHDVIAKKLVEVTINCDAKTLLVYVDGKCELRVNAPVTAKPTALTVVIDDQRLKEYK